MKTRVGQGFDVHAFAPGDHVTLCGKRIEHGASLAAHSDGDVALHALCDALLGAAALGDIGKHFPPGEDAWANADSRDLLRRVNAMLTRAGWSVVNTDLTIICEAPKIGPHVDDMRSNIAADLGLDTGDVSVKATTTERLGFTGREEGIAATAIALIRPV
jgi:2-C-methyl-D-erythritol 2,4-cyclodiphosphate synthase